MNVQRVAIVAFDGIRPFHLSVPCAVFGEGNDDHGQLFDIRVCAMEPGDIRTHAGFSIGTRYGLAELSRADIVVMPSWRHADEAAPPALLAALRRAHRRGATIVGLCLGACVLAEAGLLDGRRATTHWRWGDRFAARFPKVHFDPGVLYVDEGDILTSAGTAAGIDCCLHLVRRHHGAEVTNRLARTLVVPPHRQGNQAQYIEQPMPPNRGDDHLSSTLYWAAQHLEQAHNLDSLADRSNMSRRTFTRHFRKATGTTVGQWLLSQRLAFAQRLLETTDRPIDHIAGDAGFGSALSMRQHFHAAFATSPSAYRREFRG
ncbi:MAG TPA: helix-turn-helix domain-containing protein [Luteibacter sp.]|nr:helix-turn-helix domain-containing protein [Luteibacter sp.]